MEADYEKFPINVRCAIIAALSVAAWCPIVALYAIWAGGF